MVNLGLSSTLSMEVDIVVRNSDYDPWSILTINDTHKDAVNCKKVFTT
jgi:hypothetical protein